LGNIDPADGRRLPQESPSWKTIGLLHNTISYEAVRLLPQLHNTISHEAVRLLPQLHNMISHEVVRLLHNTISHEAVRFHYQPHNRVSDGPHGHSMPRVRTEYWYSTARGFVRFKNLQRRILG